MRGDPTDHLAEELERRGVAAPARLLLDAHRPLRPLLAQAGIFLGPLAGPLLGRRFAELQGTLEDDAAYDRLVARLGETGEDADPEGGDA
jgi:hypothetical protein